jgi:tellurite resistance protein TerC
MYFLLADALRRFELLKYALALVLIFVGLKMTVLNAWYDGKFPIEWSLGIIALLLVGAVIASVIRGARDRHNHLHET